MKSAIALFLFFLIAAHPLGAWAQDGAKTELRIGATLPLTGELAYIGKAILLKLKTGSGEK